MTHDLLPPPSPSASQPATYPCGTPIGTPPLDRRALLISGGTAVAGLLGYTLLRGNGGEKSPVFLARHQRYDGPLAQTIREGLLAVGFDPASIRGKRVLLKPNLVEPNRHVPQMTTHPAMIVAAADAFRGWGASVVVGEGSGHVRDTEAILGESGVGEALRDAGLEFVDLNYDAMGAVPNRGKVSKLTELHLPRTLLEAHLVVSLPKLKTHHWVGITASLKNMYGVLPGIKYGWPKNVLHHAGIPQTVVDINASLPPTIGIVDGILCMEGDGPIMGTPKPMGLVAVGLDRVALDATLARIMGIEPVKLTYLQLASGRLGDIADRRIVQRGERWQQLVSPFQILDWPHLRGMRSDVTGVRVT
ncbi:MAG: DUF362 domain-containing protein [Pirellulales bacterium]|nr:DUF362 domain-containing protein [Pirellulales bacterium]